MPSLKTCKYEAAKMRRLAHVTYKTYHTKYTPFMGKENEMVNKCGRKRLVGDVFGTE